MWCPSCKGASFSTLMWATNHFYHRIMLRRYQRHRKDQALTKIVKKLLKCLYLSLKNSEIAGVIWKLSVSMFCENLGYLFAVRAFWKRLQKQGSGAQDKGPFLAILDDHTLKVYVYISHVVLVPTFFGTGEVPGSCGLNSTAIFKCSFLSVVIKLSMPSPMPCPPKSFALFCLFACTFLHNYIAHKGWLK